MTQRNGVFKTLLSLEKLYQELAKSCEKDERMRLDRIFREAMKISYSLQRED